MLRHENRGFVLRKRFSVPAHAFDLDGMKVRPYKSKDKEGLIALWQACGLVNPKNDPAKDIRRKLEVKPGWIFVGEEKDRIVASVMAGYEGHRGWINYLAVAPDLRKRGLGRKILEHAEKKLFRLGCPKINLQVRKGNTSVLGFYRTLGYQEDEVVSLGKRLVDDSIAGKRTKRIRP